MTNGKKILLGVLLAAVAFAASLTYLVVDVRETGPQGFRIWAPVPLVVAQAALHFAPEEKIHVDSAKLSAYVPLARTLLTELQKTGDADLVAVETPAETVLISKKADNLLIDVSSPENEVKISFPLKTLAQMLSRCEDGRLDLAGVLSVLRWSSSGSVQVRTPENEVKLSLW